MALLKLLKGEGLKCIEYALRVIAVYIANVLSWCISNT